MISPLLANVYPRHQAIEFRHTLDEIEKAVPDIRLRTPALNLGNDDDTVGAVTDKVAGALYGASAIPARWLAPLACRDRIEAGAERLIATEI